MFYVYVLKNFDGQVYKGMTNNIERRISEHKKGNTKSTRNFKDFKLIYTKEFNTRAEARSYEIYLKTAAGRKFLKCRGSSDG